jgi:hypothetical protein
MKKLNYLDSKLKKEKKYTDDYNTFLQKIKNNGFNPTEQKKEEDEKTNEEIKIDKITNGIV